MNPTDSEYDTGSEDEDGKYATDAIDIKIFDLLGAIRRNDPELKNKSFFEDDVTKQEDQNVDDTKSQHQRDFERQQTKQELNKKRIELIDKFFASNKDKTKRIFKLKDIQDHQGTNRTPSEMELQEQARREFQLAVKEEFDEEDNDDDEALLKKKEKTSEDLEQEEKEFEEFKEKFLLREKDAIGKKTASLSHLGEDQILNEEDKFLRDYLLNKMWVGNKKKGKSADEEMEYIEEDLRRDEIMEELEKKAQEENLNNNLLPDKTNQYRYQEQGGAHIKMYPTTYKSTIREKKPSKRERYAKRRNERFREILHQTRVDQKKKAREIQRKIIRKILELKQLIQGDGSVIDRLDLTEKNLTGIDEEPNDEEEEEKTDEEEPKTQLGRIWQKVEHNDVVEELMYADIDDIENNEEIDDDEDDNEETAKRREWERTASPQEKKIRALRREIRNDFEQFYELFFEEVGISDDKYRFKYKRVEKDDYGLSTLDMLELDDEDLDKVVPINFVTRWDAKPASEKVKEQVKHKLKKIQYHNRQVNHYAEPKDYNNYDEEYSNRPNNRRNYKNKPLEQKRSQKRKRDEKTYTDDNLHYNRKLKAEAQEENLEQHEAIVPRKTFSFKFAQEAEREMKNKENKKLKEAKKAEQQKEEQAKKQKTEKVQKTETSFNDGFLRVKKKSDHSEHTPKNENRKETISSTLVKKMYKEQEGMTKAEESKDAKKKKSIRRGSRGKKKKQQGSEETH